jgi:hypothetical protein
MTGRAGHNTYLFKLHHYFWNLPTLFLIPAVACFGSCPCFWDRLEKETLRGQNYFHPIFDS